MNQSVENPDEGNSHNLTCTFTLPSGVSQDLLRIEWSGHMSVSSSNNSSRVTISDLTSMGSSRQYTKTVTFQQVQPVDNGNYICTVTIMGFANSSDNITVNGKYVFVYIVHKCNNHICYIYSCHHILCVCIYSAGVLINF